MWLVMILDFMLLVMRFVTHIICIYHGKYGRIWYNITCINFVLLLLLLYVLWHLYVQSFMNGVTSAELKTSRLLSDTMLNWVYFWQCQICNKFFFIIAFVCTQSFSSLLFILSNAVNLYNFIPNKHMVGSWFSTVLWYLLKYYRIIVIPI